MKKHFNKNLIMTEKEEQFQSSNKCWICEKFIEDEKVRDHCHIIRKFSGNINLQLIKKFPVIIKIYQEVQ